jgi:hypothetical protein
MVQPGDWVRLIALPERLGSLPEESQQVFRFCLGRTYRVDELDPWGHLVLDVSPDIDHRFGGYMNDIRVEQELVEVVPKPD